MNRRSFLSPKNGVNLLSKKWREAFVRDVTAAWRSFQVARLRGHMVALGLTGAADMTDEEIIEGARSLQRLVHEAGVTVEQFARAFDALRTKP